MRVLLRCMVLSLVAAAIGCAHGSPASVADLADRVVREEAILAASVEPVIRQMLAEWEPWGKTYSGKPVITDYRHVSKTFAFAKIGQPPFRPATDREIQQSHQYPALFRCVEVDGVLMKPTEIETRDGDRYEIQAIERTYSYAFDRVDRIHRTADPDYPLEAVIRVVVTTQERVTSKEKVDLAPDAPEGYRRLTELETARWRMSRSGFTLWGGCNSIHAPRHRMPKRVRDLDLPLPGHYHSYPNGNRRYHSGLADDDAVHPAPVQEVINRHVQEWSEMAPSVLVNVEFVSLWYARAERNWIVREPETRKFTDENMED